MFDEPTPVNGSALRLLAAACRIHGRGEPVTVRGLCGELKLASPNAVRRPLGQLVRMGLARRDRRTAGGIVPLVSLQLFPAAFNGRKAVPS